jgi:hypothetical protein
VIIRFATVKMTLITSTSVYNKKIYETQVGYSPSAESGPSKIAQNAHHHQDHSGLIIAISNGDIALSAEVNNTK